MAWKEDTFWENHPQPTSPPDCWHWKPAPRTRQGLRLKPRFQVPVDTIFVVNSVFVILLQQLAPELLEPLHYLPMYPVFFLVWFSFHFVLLSSLIPRYYLFDAVSQSFLSRKPAHLYSLLKRIASDAILLEHLGETDWRRAPAGIGWSQLYTKSSILVCLCFLAIGGIAALLKTVNVYWCLNMSILTVTTLYVVLLYRRVSPSRPRDGYEGRGEPPDDSDRVPYDRVRTATLHWDRLLQREFLLLEHDSGHMRYYNFTGDPLYLLRLWKERMPATALRVPHVSS
jgi:hypothetical protein